MMMMLHHLSINSKRRQSIRCLNHLITHSIKRIDLNYLIPHHLYRRNNNNDKNNKNKSNEYYSKISERYITSIESKEKKKFVKIRIDRSGLLGNYKLDDLDNDDTIIDNDDVKMISDETKEVLTPLGKDLISYIKIRGPITLHDYMSQCLNHLIHGYYQSTDELIGEHGDFITAPEISQLFGEMIGVWCVNMWYNMNSPKKINIIELGPGKGMMSMILMMIMMMMMMMKRGKNDECCLPLLLFTTFDYCYYYYYYY